MTGCGKVRVFAEKSVGVGWILLAVVGHHMRSGHVCSSRTIQVEFRFSSASCYIFIYPCRFLTTSGECPVVLSCVSSYFVKAPHHIQEPGPKEERAETFTSMSQRENYPFVNSACLYIYIYIWKGSCWRELKAPQLGPWTPVSIQLKHFRRWKYSPVCNQMFIQTIQLLHISLRNLKPIDACVLDHALLLGTLGKSDEIMLKPPPR